MHVVCRKSLSRDASAGFEILETPWRIEERLEMWTLIDTAVEKGRWGSYFTLASF